MLYIKFQIFLLFILLSVSSYSISYQFEEKLVWDPVQKVEIHEGFTVERLSFEGAVYTRFEPVPHFVKIYPIHSSDVNLSLSLANIITVNATESETELLVEFGFNDTVFSVTAVPVVSRKEPFAQIKIVPVRWNLEKKIFEKLIDFQIILEVEEKAEALNPGNGFRENSVLETGDWFKIRVDKSGIYKITYQELNEMGFNVGVNPKSIAVFGNGGGVLPEKNDDFRYDDLFENPIVVIGEEDGNFDPSDYVLFYAEGPTAVNYNPLSGHFFHKNNYYDDYSYYFITSLNTSAKRISEIEETEGPSGIEVTEFSEFAMHEIDELNLAGTGKVWYGEMFDFNSTYEFDFNFPNAIANQEARFKADFAAIAETPSQFEISINNTLENTLIMHTVSPTNTYQIARGRGTEFDFNLSGDQVKVSIKYVRTSNSSSGYLNYLTLNVRRKLKMFGNQMSFREPMQSGQVAKYIVSGANSSIDIWDITEAVNPQKVKAQLVSDKLEFYASTDELREYIAFDGGMYFKTEFVEKVQNQNLHNLRNIDYVIVAHPDFISQANLLADFHRSNGLSVYVTIPDVIYNEFSSGSQDVTAIRDFAKMLYDNSEPGKEIKYLLLFGDASYDYKHINTNAADLNFVPCWESVESLNIVWSVASDDYFGYLDDGEGIPGSGSDKVDIGIGRFVVANEEEAEMAVNKSIHYGTKTEEVMGSWRTILTFVADDGDNNTHLKHGEYLSDYVQEFFPVYNIDKIYLDAYQQISTPAGQRAPDMNNAINQRIEKGTLIVNYNGHGGEIGWGHERFLQIADINSWDNYDRMPIFITATCEFSRYDDPTRVSAGELVFLNEKGGAIALFSTARATFASTNLVLNAAIYENNIFTKTGGKYPRFGDVIRQSKVLGGDNDKKFILLGDPALRLAYTDYETRTTLINHDIVIEDQPDTLKALQRVVVEGIVVDDEGSLVESFNGTLYPTVYDKFSEIVTLGDEGPAATFYLRKNILFNGKASIENGRFMFEFIVPKDIAYNYGVGRISYYLNNDSEDGAGYYEGIIIGGFDDQAAEDNTGPEIQLFMNDTTFKAGDITDQNPILLAKLFDESGINTTGNGIGHDIIAIVDDEKAESHSLNKYYEANRDSYNSGKISYPFKDLPDGPHVLSLKVWDIYNNSSTAYLEFLVTSKEELVVQNLMNYPNPFTNSTNFVFDHNQSGQELDVKILIFNSSGALVKTIETRVTPEGYQSTPIYWDGTTDAGGKIGRGFYVYQTIVQNPDGATAQDQSKLIFIR